MQLKGIEARDLQLYLQESQRKVEFTEPSDRESLSGWNLEDSTGHGTSFA